MRPLAAPYARHPPLTLARRPSQPSEFDGCLPSGPVPVVEDGVSLLRDVENDTYVDSLLTEYIQDKKDELFMVGTGMRRGGENDRKECSRCATALFDKLSIDSRYVTTLTIVYRRWKRCHCSRRWKDEVG